MSKVILLFFVFFMNIITSMTQPTNHNPVEILNPDTGKTPYEEYWQDIKQGIFEKWSEKFAEKYLDTLNKLEKEKK